MEEEQYLILLKGQDKTKAVAAFQRGENGWEIQFQGSQKVYRYGADRVRVLEVQRRLEPSQWIVTLPGKRLRAWEKLLDFGEFYRIYPAGASPFLCSKDEVVLRPNCLAGVQQAQLFSYFKKTAAAVGLTTEGGLNLLYQQYERCRQVGADTALARYLSPEQPPLHEPLPETVLYPFGLNRSQKDAVENALSAQVSIIQGPPGTGKTQTILNIIANAVFAGKTVAVVSNNNSATANVMEKLERRGLSFLAAFLGNRENKERFLSTQTGRYPDLREWERTAEETNALKREIAALSQALSQMFDTKNRIAAIEQELLALTPEQHYFQEYYVSHAQSGLEAPQGLSSQKLLSLWVECEQQAEAGARPGLLKQLSILLRFRRSAFRLFRQSPAEAIPALQQKFYVARRAELAEEKARLEAQLAQYAFDEQMQLLAEKSMRLFRAGLAKTCPWKTGRKIFDLRDFWEQSCAFNREYPILLSTTHSIKSVLQPDHVYDYLIVDEASQVDLATGVLALSCARKVVVVGDLQQLPNVLDSRQLRASEALWAETPLPEGYHFSAHSLLSSALAVWPEAPAVLLREHYRCHPKIIGFCNQKFYGGELIPLTKDRGEPDVLTLYRTAPGNHARGHRNQRQIDVIQTEVLPRLAALEAGQIGIVTPYREQASALRAQLGEAFEIATVHKFQGREKDAVILTSVDNVITEFVNDPRMLNVAVSRAVRSLSVVTSQDPRNDRTLYGELARYIEYNNCAVVESTVYSVFDLLYQGYAQQRRSFLQKHRKISQYDSENLLSAVLEELLRTPEFSSVGAAAHVSLTTLLRDTSRLSPEEALYACNPLTHLDFLLFRRVDRSPLLAVEVDGVAFHAEGTRQANRDRMKNHILEIYGLPLLRLRTDGSGERGQLAQALRSALGAGGKGLC